MMILAHFPKHSTVWISTMSMSEMRLCKRFKTFLSVINNRYVYKPYSSRTLKIHQKAKLASMVERNIKYAEVKMAMKMEQIMPNIGVAPMTNTPNYFFFCPWMLSVFSVKWPVLFTFYKSIHNGYLCFLCGRGLSSGHNISLQPLLWIKDKSLSA